MKVNEYEAQEIAYAPDQLQDRPKPQRDELEEVNMAEKKRRDGKTTFH